MKPTVIVIVSIVTAFVIGIGSLQFYRAPEVVQQLSTDTAAADRLESDSLQAGHQTTTAAIEGDTDSGLMSQEFPGVVNNERLELVGVKQRRVKRSGDLEYWTWRVEVKNHTGDVLTSCVEIEWLDENGVRVDHAYEVRKIEPGTRSISKVHTMGLETAARVKTVRVVGLRERSPGS
jgi:hypothetical protein